MCSLLLLWDDDIFYTVHVCVSSTACESDSMLMNSVICLKRKTHNTSGSKVSYMSLVAPHDGLN